MTKSSNYYLIVDEHYDFHGKPATLTIAKRLLYKTCIAHPNTVIFITDPETDRYYWSAQFVTALNFVLAWKVDDTGEKLITSKRYMLYPTGYAREL